MRALPLIVLCLLVPAVAIADTASGGSVVDSRSQLLLCRGSQKEQRPAATKYKAKWYGGDPYFDAIVTMAPSPTLPNRYGDGLAAGTCSKEGTRPTGNVCFTMTPLTAMGRAITTGPDGRIMPVRPRLYRERSSDGTSKDVLEGLEDWFNSMYQYAALEVVPNPYLRPDGCTEAYTVVRVSRRGVDYRPIRYYTATDIAGGDYREVAVDDSGLSYVDRCLSYCSADARCKAVTLLGKRCFMKDVQGPTSARSDTVSAYVDPR